MVLSASETYTGATSISTGTLQVNFPLSTSGIALSNSGVFAANIANAWQFNNLITGTGSVVKSGAATLTLNNNGNTYNGGTTVNGGSIVVIGFGASGSTVGDLGTGTISLNAGGTLQLNPDNVGGGSNTYHVANSVLLNGGTYYAYDGLQHLASGPGATINVTAPSTIENSWTGKNLSRRPVDRQRRADLRQRRERPGEPDLHHQQRRQLLGRAHGQRQQRQRPATCGQQQQLRCRMRRST